MITFECPIPIELVLWDVHIYGFPLQSQSPVIHALPEEDPSPVNLTENGQKYQLAFVCFVFYLKFLKKIRDSQLITKVTVLFNFIELSFFSELSKMPLVICSKMSCHYDKVMA